MLFLKKELPCGFLEMVLKRETASTWRFRESERKRENHEIKNEREKETAIKVRSAFGRRSTQHDHNFMA